MLSNRDKKEILERRMRDVKSQIKNLESKYVELYGDWYALWMMELIEEKK